MGVAIASVPLLHPVDGQPMHLNVWDFAGQQIEHATHQFFLTPGALYLILWNARLGWDYGKRDVYYWLELLRLRVPRAKFLLIATHTELTPPDLPLSDIQELSGDSFQGNYAVDLCTMNGFPALQTRIAELAAQSTSMNSRWNHRWLAVRDKVRDIKKSERYLRPEAFQNLMAQCGVTAREEQIALAGELHELGEIIYHLERSDLDGFVLLDAEWVTELVGLVVRSQAVRESGGVLRKADLDALWRGALVPSELKPHLLRLIDVFDLTYETREFAEIGIVVEALPVYNNQQLPEWDAAEGEPQVSMVLEFPNLHRRPPPGIPTWGIARAHRFSACKPWRNLALFRHSDGSLGKIEADELRRKVYLRVRSHYPPYLHSILRDVLEDTIKRYPGVQPRVSVPCDCQPNCSHTFPLDFLMQKQSQKRPTVDCQQSGEERPVAQLLMGLVPAVPFEPDRSARYVVEAVNANMRRDFTAQWRGKQELIESTCPNVFLLHPRRNFDVFKSLTEYLTQGEQWRLTLFCECDEGWHETASSVYDFGMYADWIESARPHWNLFADRMRQVAPYLKLTGKLTEKPIIEAVAFVAEKLPEIAADQRKLREELGDAYSATRIHIELRRTLTQLIEQLDGDRSPKETTGSLHKSISEDGRVLWLCSQHYEARRTRVNLE